MMNLNLSNQTLLYIIIGLFIVQFVVMRYYVNSTIDQEKHTNNKKIIKQMTEQINSTFDKYADKSRLHSKTGHISESVSPRTPSGYANKYNNRPHMNETDNNMSPDKQVNKSRSRHTSSKQQNEYEINNNPDIDSIEDPADNDNEALEEEQNQGQLEEHYNNELSEV